MARVRWHQYLVLACRQKLLESVNDSLVHCTCVMRLLVREVGGIQVFKYLYLSGGSQGLQISKSVIWKLL